MVGVGVGDIFSKQGMFVYYLLFIVFIYIYTIIIKAVLPIYRSIYSSQVTHLLPSMQLGVVVVVVSVYLIMTRCSPQGIYIYIYIYITPGSPGHTLYQLFSPHTTLLLTILELW